MIWPLDALTAASCFILKQSRIPAAPERNAESQAPPDLSQNQHFRSWKRCARGSLETEACASERAGAQSWGASCLCPGTGTLVRYCLPEHEHAAPVGPHHLPGGAPDWSVCLMPRNVLQSGFLHARSSVGPELGPARYSAGCVVCHGARRCFPLK